ncbi:5,6-dimethylbenzimidazole synthase [Roseobacter sinensis]|uniref:5,6-dimethylbenzimidazole synthase n=1 Tax=Roseobacter sinensis TaxID=2931391 RepID=A0ABT3B9B9_9RHOB|nr:5,6-dimethylbenzimidazole synthase [Roseobacter sp. WL0113]MCV3270177.1 5,6-dimethylbenzimidazole synthase [Roseobacter sp. WL0113]
MELTRIHRDAFDELLTWRRDVRHFRSDPVPEAVLDRLRVRMELSPSVGNARPWRVIRVDSTEKRAAVIESFELCNRAAADAYDLAERQKYLALKLAGLREAPVHLAVFTDLAVDEGKGLGRQTMPEMLSYSTVMAIHTLWLAARVENIGVGWVSILDPDAVAKALEVPPDWSLTGYLCLGYAETTSDTPLLHETGWQENTATHWQMR